METLRRLRTEKGLSQARLAARAELDPSTVNQIERGAREASPATLRKLAEALDVSLTELLEDTSPKDQAPLWPDESAAERRAIGYLRGITRAIDALDLRAGEAIARDEVDLGYAQALGAADESLWRDLVPTVGLLKGLPDMPEKERALHQEVYASLLGFGGTVAEAYDVSTKKLLDQKADVAKIDKARQRHDRQREAVRERGQQLPDAWAGAG